MVFGLGEVVDGVGHGLGGHERFEADEGDVGGDEEDGGGESDGGGGFEVVAAAAEGPGEERADEEGHHGDDGGFAEGGEGWAGEVEDVGHGEGVSGDLAMGDGAADVGGGGDSAEVKRP